MPTSAFGAHTITMDKIQTGNYALVLSSVFLNIPEFWYCFVQCELNCALTVIDSPLEPLTFLQSNIRMLALNRTTF